jgi:hypothetical protein
MIAGWSALSPESSMAVREVVAELLHDWIKYMEMRLLSLDWSEPPASAPALLRKAIHETRRHGDRTQSARALWESQRGRLMAVAQLEPGGAAVETLVAALDGDLDALERLVETGGIPQAGESQSVEEVIRRPGRRLRAVRDAMVGGASE